MTYPTLFIVKLIGQQDILGVYVGFDEEEARYQVAMLTGWPPQGVTVEDKGDVSEVPIVVTAHG